jgi:hypothetical protein
VVKIGDKIVVFYYMSSQTDGQTEVVNLILSTMLWAVLKSNLKLWEECLLHIDLA